MAVMAAIVVAITKAMICLSTAARLQRLDFSFPNISRSVEAWPLTAFGVRFSCITISSALLLLSTNAQIFLCRAPRTASHDSHFFAFS